MTCMIALTISLGLVDSKFIVALFKSFRHIEIVNTFQILCKKGCRAVILYQILKVCRSGYMPFAFTHII